MPEFPEAPYHAEYHGEPVPGVHHHSDSPIKDDHIKHRLSLWLLRGHEQVYCKCGERWAFARGRMETAAALAQQHVREAKD